MRVDPNTLHARIRKRARRSICRFPVVAIGLDARGKYIGIASNRPRFYRAGGEWHAEEVLMHSSPPTLARILIARVGMRGEFLPIDPCERCRRLAEKFGVGIERLQGDEG